MEELLAKIANCVERGKIDAKSPFPPDLRGQDGASELTAQALQAGIPANDILQLGLMPGMKRIGERFRDCKIFVPDVLIAAKAMHAAMAHLKPYFSSGEVALKGKIVMGTVAGDLHDIGKNIVKMVIEGGGWNVVDLGVDVSVDKFVNAVTEHAPQALGLSALLTTTMVQMETIVKRVKALRPDIQIIIGGAPITHEFAEKIGADCYSPDPQGALEYLNKACFS